MLRSRSLLDSFRYALTGLTYAVTTQRNMKVHFVLGCAVLVAAWTLRVSPGETAALLLAVAVVIVAEIINTSIEVVIDLVSPEYHPLAGTAKNLAAAAVVISAFFAVVIGLVVLGPPSFGWLWTAVTSRR